MGKLSPEPIRQKEIIYWFIYIILILNLFIEENDRKANISKYLDSWYLDRLRIIPFILLLVVADTVLKKKNSFLQNVFSHLEKRRKV